jgi:hypothetical protein
MRSARDQTPIQLAKTRSEALRLYLGVIAIGNLVWELLQLPFYTIWDTGPFGHQACAALHCTLGDVLIAASTLAISLVLVGDRHWPWRRSWPVTSVTIFTGLAYTVFSEWLNVDVRASWTYSEWMPLIRVLGLNIGLSPLLQWVVVPAAAFAITSKQVTNRTKKSVGTE